MSQGKVLMYNGSARVVNLSTYPSQPTQNNQIHYALYGALFLSNALFTKLAAVSIYRHQWNGSRVFPF